MDKGKLIGIGIIFVAAAIILNQLKLESDLADFFMGAFIAVGIVLLIKGLFKPKKDE